MQIINDIYWWTGLHTQTLSTTLLIARVWTALSVNLWETTVFLMDLAKIQDYFENTGTLANSKSESSVMYFWINTNQTGNNTSAKMNWFLQTVVC